MKHTLATIAALAALTTPAIAADGYFYGSAAMNLGRSDGTAYTLGAGIDDGDNRVSAELQRSNTARGTNRTGFALQAAHNFADVAGYTPYVGVGVGYAADRLAGHSSAMGASVDAEAGMTRQLTDALSIDGFIRQTHDFVREDYQRDHTEVGLRARWSWGE